ncbi:MAG: hypothetical protein ACJ8J7_02600 [Sulfurifustaceae bacterium]
MKSWREALKSAVVPGIVGGAVTSVTAARRARKESGSAVAAINATSHVVWGDDAAKVEQATLKHTGPGYLINSAAAFFWAVVFEKLFGAAVDRRGAPAALLGAAATAGLAYITDYKIVPRRLTPGYEKRVSGRSLLMIYSVIAGAFAAGALLTRTASRSTS